LAFELTQLLSLIKPIGECILKYIKPILYSPAIQKLRSQESVSFKEISDAIGKDENEPYSPEEVFHHLLRPVWRGEFENRKGESRLWIPSGDGSMLIAEGQIFHSVEQKEIINRRWLLQHIPALGINYIYSPPQQELEDEQISWKNLKKTIPWDKLALIEPQNYDPFHTENILKKLRMPQKDFKKWLKNFRKGKYAQ